MPENNTQALLETVAELRNWVRAAAHAPVRALLASALPDEKSRRAYQMFDGVASAEHVRIACKMSPNAVVALANRCVSMGLMETTADKKRRRLFDLRHFGLISEES